MDEILVSGINFRSGDNWEAVNSNFDESKVVNFIDGLSRKKNCSVVMLKTCNRFEIYSEKDISSDILQLEYLMHLPQHSFFIKSGQNAIDHLFKVSSGIDSQLLGEIEILGQFKQAFKQAKDQNRLKGFMEKLANTCIASAKNIRTHTKLTSGTTSLSYATIQALKNINLNKSQRILLIGAGEFAKPIAKNLSSYMNENALTICNRTLSKAQELAMQSNASVLPFEELSQTIHEFDVVISAVHTKGGVINESQLKDKPTVVIDLSVPGFFDLSETYKQSIHFFDLDILSNIISDSIHERANSLPEAMDIIELHKKEFVEWASVYEKSHIIQSWKQTVKDISEKCPHFNDKTEKEREYVIKKSVSQFVKYIKQTEMNNETVCIPKISSLLSCSSNSCALHSAIPEPATSNHCNSCQIS